jgi:hypothetical protein
MTTFIIFLSLIIAIVLISFFSKREKMLTEIKSEGGIQNKYQILVSKLLQSTNARIATKTSDEALLIIADLSRGKIKFTLFPSFTTLHIKCEINLPGYPVILTNCEFPQNMSQLTMYDKLFLDIAYAIEEKTGASGLLDAAKSINAHNSLGLSGSNTLEFDKVNEYRENLAVVSKNKKYGFINKSRQIVIPLIYDNCFGFSEGLAAVKKNTEYGYINRNGDVVIPFQFYEANFFHNSLAIVRKDLFEKAGVIDLSGNIKIPFIYDNIFMLHDSIVVINNKLWGILDFNGVEIIPCFYDKLEKVNDYYIFKRGLYYGKLILSKGAYIEEKNEENSVLGIEIKNKFKEIESSSGPF